MDYDRKSTVSSFYGGRRSSVDALNTDFNLPPGAARPRVDSTSSFYGANRVSRADPYDAQTAGYNQSSYFDAGRTEPVKGGDEEAAWDVYADFNNAGPRYSTAFGMGMGDTGCVQPHMLWVIVMIGLMLQKLPPSALADTLQPTKRQVRSCLAMCATL